MEVKVKQSLVNLYNDYWELHQAKMQDGTNALEIAAIIMTQALTIYKTVLSEDAFDMIVDSISESRDRVQRVELISVN